MVVTDPVINPASYPIHKRSPKSPGLDTIDNESSVNLLPIIKCQKVSAKSYNLIIIWCFVGLAFLKLKLTISNHNLKSFSDHLPINSLNLANCDMDSTMMSCKISYYFHGIIFVSLVHYLQSQKQLKDTIYMERYMYF